ncbi:NAD(+)/NADH kinase [Conexibacter sp. JD483]|uniref:NAD(+)/NADH kinase n=1 Tax=unclassified Conexibacter TaxID=2627773 RepID=UPI002715724D|nr:MULTISPECIES: NAD(+)/NADH kinase [unclassified Conexibacter]MDO8185080.1 NAD(+)/NADH kinase [Conexibacter sp. CPCC 205706]MDO8196790.1 NAD(+)/NADH kinase [Conexibacter sp. CPCC 205762]MDR9368038.1 NAD(+)/NADH kinase [Conexibacter sp. JD483]
MSERKVATVFTHRRPTETSAALGELVAAARAAGFTLRFSPEETIKHGLQAEPGIEVDAAPVADADLCVVLGGDGTILHGLRTYARTGVPVFGVNYGEVGFLATVDPDHDVARGLRQAFAGDFEVLSLPGIEAQSLGGEWLAMNDVSFQRQQGLRVADLAVEVGDEEVARVRCDGLVVATPAGSTGYNLANGGPVMAWGVEGLAVSYIAPHSLTARALVVAPADPITIRNRSREEPVDVSIDGRPVCELLPGGALSARFRHDVGTLAQAHDASFYHRLREKFGRLASGA